MCVYVIYICQNYNRVVALQAYTDDGVKTDLDDFEDWKIDPPVYQIYYSYTREGKQDKWKKERKKEKENKSGLQNKSRVLQTMVSPYQVNWTGKGRGSAVEGCSFGA